MNTLPRAARFYIWTLITLAALLLGIALLSFPQGITSFGTFLLFAFFSIVAGLFPVVLPRKLVEMTAGVAVDIAAILLFPFSLAILVPAIGNIANQLYRRRVWYKSLFNVSHVVVTYTILYCIVRLFYPDYGFPLGDWHTAVGLLVLGVAYYLLNNMLVVLIIALAGRIPFRYVWQTNLRSITWHHVSMVCAGFLLAFLWTVEPWTIIFVLLPVVVLREAMAVTAQLETQTYEAIEALVDAVDARDHSTHQHSERVASYSRKIAEAMRLEQSVIERIAISARLHDLGKVGIGDAWLHKTGPLSDEERSQFQSHPILGADIVARFTVLGVEKGMVLYHHEHWDGHGYPDGLKGDAIPLGARIICVADSFDAMTSDRPYRKALSTTEARRRLREASGTQFDPFVLQYALDVLPGAEADARAGRASPEVPPPPDRYNLSNSITMDKPV